MSQTQSSTLHFLSSSAPVTAVPLTIVAWFTTSGGQGRKIVAVANSASLADVFQLGLDFASATNKIQALMSNASFGNQALSSVACDTSGNWNHGAAVFASTTSRAAYLNGGSKGSTTNTIANPSGLNELLVSGRSSDFTFGIAGQIAHAAVYSRALTDNEVAYLGAGGNPRAIKNCIDYYRFHSGDSPVLDETGTLDLTPSGTMGAGTTNPNVETYRTGTALGAQSYTVGVAITAINMAAGGPVFDEVSAAFTATLKQLGTATQPTATSSALTTVREIPVGSVTGISAGDYIKVTSGGTPTRVLWVDATNAKLLVADDQTFASSAQIFRYAVNSLSVSGLSITSNSFGGTPTVAQTNNLCFFRATNNSNSALFADTDVFTMTITGGGGGGGSGVATSGYFCGGFQGG